jgi:large subunit ribosomal protein L22
MKRIRPAPMGRAYRYQRRMSHLEIAVAEKPGAAVAAGQTTAAPAKKAVRKPPAKKAPAKKAPAKKAPAKKKK